MKLAREIRDDLMTNDVGDCARRLQLRGPHEEDYGGRNATSIDGVITTHLAPIREALEFYGEPTRWQTDGRFNGADEENVRADGGQRARAALARMEDA